MQSILFIVPYFGKWPVWMPLYVDSIKRNPTVHFLFVTDCDTNVFDKLNNVKCVSSSFEAYVARFKAILGEGIQINDPYKICDLRPFFALVHEQDIAQYDFFGWTDTDLVFGDIRSFYTAKLLRNYDVFSTHVNRLSGHCALLRNSEKHKKIGFRIYQWKRALEKPEFVGIDEHGITNALQMTIFDKVAEKFNRSKDNLFCNIVRKWKVRKHYFVEQFTTPFTPIPWIDGTLNDAHPSNWLYNQGSIHNDRDADRKFMYLHFMNFKSSTWRVNQTPAPWQSIQNIYTVTDELKPVRINCDGFKSDRN